MASITGVTRKSRMGSQSRSSDRSFTGKLIELKRDIRVDSFGRNRSYHRFTIKGAFSEKTYEYVGDAQLDLRSYYELGEKVRHHAGYALPSKVKREPSDSRICIECGEMIPHGRYTCPYCGSGVR